ncbi:ROK family protein [Floricoccus tropicus]|nr:ROK family protein [Floricoccus tropicus]
MRLEEIPQEREIMLKHDTERDKGLKEPYTIKKIKNLSYGPHGKENKFDIYYPKGTHHPLPTIVNIHGGGYFYGSKEIYLFYSMHLASQGFTVINFNYRLAPETKYPAPLEDINSMMNWLLDNNQNYNIDMDNLFVVGDSAGAQLAEQYATIVTNPEYAKGFSFEAAKVKIKAMALNCGLYFVDEGQPADHDFTYYFGADIKEIIKKDFPVEEFITSEFPPSFVATSSHDFLKDLAKPFAELLESKGVVSKYKLYKNKDNSYLGHVFHVDQKRVVASECNDDEIRFFRSFIDTTIHKSNMDYLSIDIGGSSVKFGLINGSGNLVEIWKRETPESLEELQAMLQSEIEEKSDIIKGIAMSIPGKINSRNGYIHTAGAIPYLYDFSMKEWVSSFTELPFVTINDGKAAALAEWWIGNLKDIENGAAIVLGSDVGCGLIVNNQLLQGPNYQAGEVSYLIRNPNRHDSQLFDNQASAVVFMKRASDILGVSKYDYQTIFYAIVNHESKELDELFTAYCRDIASLINNLQVTLDLEKIVIGGGISNQKIVTQTIKEEYYKLRQEHGLLEKTFQPIAIEECKFHNSSNLLGALYQLFIEIDARSL